MLPLDFWALVVFIACWLALEPLLGLMARYTDCITSDMKAVRQAWTRQLLRRNFLMVDAQIVGHTINSASFFGSANLIVIVGIGGAVFSTAEGSPGGIEVHASRALLLLAPLLRGLFDFIWSVRQLNYCLAAMGASPLIDQPEAIPEWAPALAALLDRALTTFSRGVRNYYFAFAASLWLLGPVPLIAGALFASLYLIWRQAFSPTAKRIRDIGALIPSLKVPDGKSAAPRSDDAPRSGE